MKRPLLLPLVPLYAAGLALREIRLQHGWETIRRLRYPVLSIGNLSTGGSGKTPLTIALARLLSDRGISVDVLSRGYGRSTSIAMRVDPAGSSDNYGDEPLLIARETGVPVFVAAERLEAGKLAEAQPTSNSSHSPRVHILDDGFQHRQLARDVDILLLSREDWHDHLLPAGNLREGQHAAKRASVIAIPANDAEFATELRAWGWTGPVWPVRRRMNVPGVDGPVAAFCGIARPDQFFAGLEAAGLRLVAKEAFADHHRYTSEDVKKTIENARKASASAIITTGKDKVRLGNLESAFADSFSLQIAELRIDFDDEQSVAAWLGENLARDSRNGDDESGETKTHL
jgi:tetraacyldisaccharide 4'-kinase